MATKYLFGFLIFGLYQSAICQIAVFDLHLEDQSAANYGLGWPTLIHVASGNEALMKLSQTVDNLISCTVISPTGVSFEVNLPPSNKYEKWGESCGLRVRNIAFEDEGRWRLTASGANNRTITGWIEVDVLQETTTYVAPPISLQDGETQAQVTLTSLDNAYCVVAKPFSESSLVPGRCAVTLDRTTRAVQGDWQIYLGLPGNVNELQTNRHITVQTERLDVGYTYGADNKLNLYCNILHTTKNITFCRFQKTTNAYGYNVVDGLSDGTHSYYGNGFVSKECGMTIENPTAADYGTWRCSVGVQMWVGNHIVQQTPMQALISVAANTRALLMGHRNEEPTRSIFVQEDAQFTLTCSSEVSLAYCWFQHPNGSQFTPVSYVDEEQQFWYTGESLEVGDCGITFAHASLNDDGKWSCYMGPRFSLGIEMTDSIQVRVTGPLAANQRELPVTVGGNTTLYCHTSNGRRPLHYCRFLSPRFVGMSLDSSITAENAILGRYYFTSERDINVGDCSLSIISVHEEDIGEWTCAAVVDNEIVESRDIINLYIDEAQQNRQYQAGIIGMAVGLSVLVVFLVGYVSYKRGWMNNGWQYLYRGRNQRVSEDYSMQVRSVTSDSISSGSSNESGNPDRQA